MKKFTVAARTMHRLSVAGMEEASRSGLRVADIDHLLLALTLEEAEAGRALRAQGLTIDRARSAVAEQHAGQMAVLGLHTDAPESGRIVFHETDGYRWSPRTERVFTQASAGRNAGDAAAVLRALLDEPSGLIVAIVRRAGGDPEAVRAALEQVAPERPSATRSDALSGETVSFVPAPPHAVWALVSDPARIPEWESSIGSVGEVAAVVAAPGASWPARAVTIAPDGKAVRTRAELLRVRIVMLERHSDSRIVWQLTFPDAQRANSRRIEFRVEPAEAGTRLAIAFAWERPTGRPTSRLRALSWLMRPLYRFAIWIQLAQVASGVSRVFR